MKIVEKAILLGKIMKNDIFIGFLANQESSRIREQRWKRAEASIGLNAHASLVRGERVTRRAFLSKAKQ